MSDVVLLDSDDDESKADSNRNLNSDRSRGEGDASVTNIPHTGEDEITVEYNHNDYADLVGPSKTFKVETTPIKPSISSDPKRALLPKRPGSMPPFALFSQEMRAKLQKEDPDIGFGDLGRRLGEMWHALKEEEKEEYRKKARQVAEQRMRTYNEAMKNLSPQKRAMVENQQRMHLNKIKKKRTSGYSIFCSEYRRKLAQEQPDLPFADISKTVADDWKLLSSDKRQSYEKRAQKFNMEEERKWRQRMMAQQSQEAKIRQMNPSLRGRGVSNRLMSARGVSNVHRNIHGLANIQQNRGRSPMSVVRRRGQFRPTDTLQSNRSGLVIASVSSLSSSAPSQNNYNLPSGISISKSADPDINLPKSISISRVEPDIQIVEENIPNKPQHRSTGSTMMTRGRGLGTSLRGRGCHVRPPTPTGRGGLLNSPIRMSHSRGRVMSSPLKRMPSTMSPMSQAMVNPMKRPRMTLNNHSGFNVAGNIGCQISLPFF